MFVRYDMTYDIIAYIVRVALMFSTKMTPGTVQSIPGFKNGCESGEFRYVYEIIDGTCYSPHACKLHSLPRSWQVTRRRHSSVGLVTGWTEQERTPKQNHCFLNERSGG